MYQYSNACQEVRVCAIFLIDFPCELHSAYNFNVKEITSIWANKPIKLHHFPAGADTLSPTLSTIQWNKRSYANLIRESLRLLHSSTVDGRWNTLLRRLLCAVISRNVMACCESELLVKVIQIRSLKLLLVTLFKYQTKI